MSLKPRVEGIQRKLGVEPDGIVGIDTVSALERVLGIVHAPERPTETPPAVAGRLTLSRTGVEQLVADEISSEAFYRQRLAPPSWPGGASGATIGIGYDLGYRTRAAIANDWSPHLSDRTVAHLQSAAGIRGADAKGVTRGLRAAGVRVPLESAKRVFYAATLPEFAGLTRRTYPGTDRLPPDAQAALVSLIYNRGGGLGGARRVEMANIKRHVRPPGPRGDRGRDHGDEAALGRRRAPRPPQAARPRGAPGARERAPLRSRRAALRLIVCRLFHYGASRPGE